MHDHDDPTSPAYDPRLRVLYGPSSRKLKSEEQFHDDGYHFRRAASRAELLADLALFSPHILLLQWEEQGPELGATMSDTQRLLEFLRDYLRIERFPILLCGQDVGGIAASLRPLGVRNYVEVGSTQAIRETLQAMASARANPTLWNMLWRDAA